VLLVKHRVVLACGFFALLTPQPEAAEAAPGSVTLRWTAPGDDSTQGRAQAYIVRYSIAPLTPANFAGATLVTGVASPKPAGTPEAVVVQNLSAGTRYYFGIVTTDDAGLWSPLSNVASTLAKTVDVGDSPLTLDFLAPWPNPARDATRCAFVLPEPTSVQVDVFDVTGRHRRSLARGRYEPGRTELFWDLRDEAGRPVGAGVYLVRARLGARSWTRRVMVAN
jgi:hypothetical protein